MNDKRDDLLAAPPSGGSAPLSTQQRCEAILRKMLELVNSGKAVTLTEDWGGHSATICVGTGHTHVGWTDNSWDEFVESLYNSLHGGPGLSWFDPEQDTAHAPDGAGASEASESSEGKADAGN